MVTSVPTPPTPRGRPHRRATSPQTSLAVSTAAHAALLVTALLGGGVAVLPDREPVAFAVEASLLQHEGAVPAAQPTAQSPPFTVEQSAPQPLVEVPLPEPDPLPWIELPPPSTAVTEPVACARPPLPAFHLLADIALRPATEPPPPQATTEPVPADEHPPADAGAEIARAEVPVPIPGHNPAPEYPESARRRRIEGTVLIRIDVDANGRVLECTLLRGSDCADLDRAALSAARRWRFLNGPGAVEVPFTFRIKLVS